MFDRTPPSHFYKMDDESELTTYVNLAINGVNNVDGAWADELIVHGVVGDWCTKGGGW